MSALKPSGCQKGDEALARGAWEEARQPSQETSGNRSSVEGFEGLGTAAWWLDQADLVFDSRERAYRLYLAAGDQTGAARVAVWLAWDYWAFRGENAVANGWLQRARRLLDGRPPCPERAWLEVREASQSDVKALLPLALQIGTEIDAELRPDALQTKRS